MNKFLSTAASLALLVSGFVAAAPAAQASTAANAVVTLHETRALTSNTNFRAEADESAAVFTFFPEFSDSQYTAIGPGKQLTFRAYLKVGNTVVARENMVTGFGAVSNVSGNTFLTNSSSGGLNVTVEMAANLFQRVDYKVSLEVFVDGVLLGSSGYSLADPRAQFRKIGQSLIATGGEDGLNVRGVTCLSTEALATLAVGDVIEARISDSNSTTYSLNSVFMIQSGGGGGRNFSFVDSSLLERTVTQDMLSGTLPLEFFGSLGSVSAGTYDPVISIKKRGGGAELASACATAPTQAPTGTASVTGLSFSIDLAGSPSGRCYLADARFPEVSLEQSFVSSSQTSCSFSGLKRGSYVAWFERISRFSFFNLPGLPSPKSAPVEYVGGNSAFQTFTGTTGGDGQGSLSLTNISYVGSDFGTERVTSDGNGGVLVGSIDAPENEYKLRRLTPSGMSTDFGGSGEVVIPLPPYNQRATGFSAPVSLGWYGTNRDKWIAVLPGPAAPSFSPLGGSMQPTTLVIATGGFTGANTTVQTISSSEVVKFCSSVVTGADNRVNSWDVQLGQIISSPASDPLMVVNCGVSHANSNFMSIPFLASFDGTEFTLKSRLGDEPTSPEKCSRTIFSAANSGATGSEVMLAAYQTTWNPTSGSCYGSEAVPSASVVSRDVFTITADYTRTAVRDVLTLDATDEPRFFSTSQPGTSLTLLVSGPKTYLLAREISGQSPNTVSKYRIGLLTSGSFGKLEDLPLLKVGSTNEFSSATSFTQIADFSENVDGSVLLARRDFGSGSTAARVNLATGELTSYQQMAASSSASGASDGISLILGNATGALNFYGVTSRTTAVLGQWVTTGAFDPALAELPINQGASNTGVSAPSMGGPTPPPTTPAPTSPIEVMPDPFTGPVVESAGTLSSVTRGSKLSLEGSNFTSVTKVTIDGKDAKVKVVADDLMEITIPTDLANGTYSLVITSSSGELTVQDAVRVANTAGLLGEGANASTKLKDDGTAKVWVFDVVGAGKVQIFVNGKEIAWVNATDTNDSKLFNGYLVRTVELAEGKNVIEVFVDGERERRTVYGN